MYYLKKEETTMSKLINKSRKINCLLQRREKKQIELSEIGNVLKETIGCNTYLINSEGEILSFNLLNDFNCKVLQKGTPNEKEISESYKNNLLKLSETRKNIKSEDHKCIFNLDKGCNYENKVKSIIPIYGGSNRLGTIMLVRFDESFTNNEIFLGEYGAAVVGMEIMKKENKNKEKKIRKQTEVEIAVNSLSYSETEAVEYILEKLEGEKGVFVISKIAKKIGISRTIVIGALKKLESAGVIETHSLGMKGTHVEILNNYLREKV